MPNFGIILEKPSPANPQKLSFKDTLRIAELLAERLKVLSEKLPYPHNPGFDPKRLKDIRTALRAVNATPNGSVSRETLDEWIEELCTARDHLGKWCVEMVTFRKPEGAGNRNGLMSDEIPF